MKGWIPMISGVAGFFAGLVILSLNKWQFPPEYAPYLSVAALAGIDTLLGGVRAGIEGRFQTDIFASGFVLNTLLAAALAYFGDHIGVNLALVAVIVIGSRVFLNLSLIRRYWLNELALKRTRATEEQPVAAPIGQEQKIGGV